MTQDKRAEIVEAMADAMHRADRLNDAQWTKLPAITAIRRAEYRVLAEAALDIALKAAAEIAYEKAADQSDWPEGPESYQSGYTVGAQHTARAILALTSKGTPQ